MKRRSARSSSSSSSSPPPPPSFRGVLGGMLAGRERGGGAKAETKRSRLHQRKSLLLLLLSGQQRSTTTAPPRTHLPQHWWELPGNRPDEDGDGSTKSSSTATNTSRRGRMKSELVVIFVAGESRRFPSRSPTTPRPHRARRSSTNHCCRARASISQRRGRRGGAMPLPWWSVAVSSQLRGQ